MSFTNLQNSTFEMRRNETATRHNPSPSSDFRSATFYCALLMLGCCIIGSFGNIVSVWVFTRRSMVSSPINVLLAALSVVDLLVLITAVAVFVVPSLNTFLYYVDPRLLYRRLVSGFYQLGLIAQTCSCWTFVLISLERYIAVCQPLSARQRLTVKKARSAFLLIFVLACFYNVPRFFEYGPDEKSEFAPWLLSNFYYFVIYFTTLYLITHFLGPFLMITILNVIIFKTIRKAKIERGKLSSSRASNKTTRTHRTTRMITLVTLIFAFCNVLPFVLNLWQALDEDIFRGKHRLAAYLTLDISNVLVVLNSSTTFVIYFLFCQKYRSILINRFFHCCRAGRSQTREPSERVIGGDSRSYLALASTGNVNCCSTD